MVYNFEGKTAILTGSTGGIGLATTEKLVKGGAKVIAFGTSEERLASLVERYGKKHITPVICNLAERDSLIEKLSESIKNSEKLDFLISNAGVTRDNLAIRMSDEEWDEVININLRATFYLNKEALKIMIRQRSGSIVNITSIIGISGNAGQANYAASKAGVIGLTKSLAQEAASRGIRINAVAPGFIETPMTDILSETIKSKVLSSIPLQSFGKPEDVANAVAFLLSDEARYITGTVLHVNGGLAMV